MEHSTLTRNTLPDECGISFKQLVTDFLIVRVLRWENLTLSVIVWRLKGHETAM